MVKQQDTPGVAEPPFRDDAFAQVLTFARGSEGEQGPLQPKHLLDGLQKMLAETFPKTIRINMEVPKSLWMVKGDPTQIDQVLLILRAQQEEIHDDQIRFAAVTGMGTDRLNQVAGPPVVQEEYALPDTP